MPVLFLINDEPWTYSQLADARRGAAGASGEGGDSNAAAATRRRGAQPVLTLQHLRSLSAKIFAVAPLRQSFLRRSSLTQTR